MQKKLQLILDKITAISGIKFELIERKSKLNPICQKCKEACAVVEAMQDLQGDMFSLQYIPCRVEKGKAYFLGSISEGIKVLYIIALKKKGISKKKYETAFNYCNCSGSSLIPRTFLFWINCNMAK